MNIIAAVLIITGLLFFLVGTIGILRLPDFYTRAHAAGKCDSLASVLVFIGVAVFSLSDPSLANVLVSIKILFVAVFVFVASPTATHAIMEASLLVGVKPWVKEKKRS
jgi:multicomponent Na+:H+ antiporter subunit G